MFVTKRIDFRVYCKSGHDGYGWWLISFLCIPETKPNERTVSDIYKGASMGKGVELATQQHSQKRPGCGDYTLASASR